MKNIILVYELHEIVATLLHAPHERHEGSIVALSVKLGLKYVALKNGQARHKGLGLAKNLVVVGQLASLDGFDIVSNQGYSRGQHLDGTVLDEQMFRDQGFGLASSTGDSGHVIKADSFRLKEGNMEKCQAQVVKYELGITSSVANV